MKTLLICGDRNWDDDDGIIGTYLKRYIEQNHLTPSELTIVEGGARGADACAAYWAAADGYKHVAVRAEWERYGKAARPIRNRTMLNIGVDMVVAFHTDLDKSKGTRDMVRQACRRDVPVEVIVGVDSAGLLMRRTPEEVL